MNDYEQECGCMFSEFALEGTGPRIVHCPTHSREPFMDRPTLVLSDEQIRIHHIWDKAEDWDDDVVYAQIKGLLVDQAEYTRKQLMGRPATMSNPESEPASARYLSDDQIWYYCGPHTLMSGNAKDAIIKARRPGFDAAADHAWIAAEKKWAYYDKEAVLEQVVADERQKAKEAAKGLVAVADDVIASVEVGLAETNDLAAVKAAKAKWDKYLEGN